ncbi:MAG: 4Fe-4S binding protein [Thermoplasmata archaeon]
MDSTKCTGCGACVTFCQYGVYSEKDGKAEVVNGYNCVVGCTGCISQCPEGAISFPSLVELRGLLRALRAKYGQS